eukprot:COSAG01_NODE_699_length_14176_cov_21.100590_20_plen_199_part_00
MRGSDRVSSARGSLFRLKPLPLREVQANRNADKVRPFRRVLVLAASSVLLRAGRRRAVGRSARRSTLLTTWSTLGSRMRGGHLVMGGGECLTLRHYFLRRSYASVIMVLACTASRWGAAATDGDGPSCAAHEYGAACRSCFADCGPGQWCVRHAGPNRVAGCHNCTEGTFDGDLDPLTPCERCQSGETSDKAATVRHV